MELILQQMTITVLLTRHSFIKHLDIKMNGEQVYDTDYADHAVNIKNLLE